MYGSETIHVQRQKILSDVLKYFTLPMNVKNPQNIVLEYAIV